MVTSAAVMTDAKNDTSSTKLDIAQMLREGVAVEVTSVDEAKFAEFAGACCVVVSSPRNNDNVSPMASPSVIEKIMKELSIPVMARVRVGHFVEAQIAESIGVKYIDEGEIGGIADASNSINQQNFEAEFVGGCRDLAEALRSIRERSVMIRIHGDPNGSGDVVGTMRSVRNLMDEIRALNDMSEDEVVAFSKRIKAPYGVVDQTRRMGRLPVVQFAAGGILSAADAALMMQLGCDGVFVGAEIWDRWDWWLKTMSIVNGVKNYSNPTELARNSDSGTKKVRDLLDGRKSPRNEFIVDMLRAKKKPRGPSNEPQR